MSRNLDSFAVFHIETIIYTPIILLNLVSDNLWQADINTATKQIILRHFKPQKHSTLGTGLELSILDRT